MGKLPSSLPQALSEAKGRRGSGVVADGKMNIMRVGLTILAFIPCVTAIAQGPENVLLVVNKSSKDSRAVAEYYQKQRAIPAGNVCMIKTLDQEEIKRVFFEDEIRKPIWNCLAKRSLQDRALYIVLTKGVPIKIKGEEGQKEDYASVDSELTLLYSDMLGIPHRLSGGLPNPYYAAHASGEFPRFSHLKFAMYLVTRLDGYDVADVRALIDRGVAARRSQIAATEPQGRFVLDLNYDDQSEGNRWLRDAASKLRDAGIPESRIQLETSEKFLTAMKDVIGYASWGSNDRANKARTPGISWLPGALATEYVSTNGRTFEKPPDGWKTGQWSDPPGTFFAGSPQGLIADYIREGVTGIAGNAYEPYLQACARPNILFPSYVRGHNLAESFYAALPYLSWQGIVVGDPLAALFAGPLLSPQEINPPLDAAAQLPKFFATRLAAAKLRSRKPPGLPPASSGPRTKSSDN